MNSVQNARGNLVVRLNRARNLQSEEFSRNPNPYVVFVYGKKRYESSVKMNTRDPVFNEEFVFKDVSHPGQSLSFSVNNKFDDNSMDEGARARSGVLGVFEVKLTKHPQWIPISTREGTSGGEVNLLVNWYSNENDQIYKIDDQIHKINNKDQIYKIDNKYQIYKIVVVLFLLSFILLLLFQLPSMIYNKDNSTEDETTIEDETTTEISKESKREIKIIPLVISLLIFLYIFFAKKKKKSIK